MNILIAGGGQVGALLARRLIREGNAVTIVDPSPERCADLDDQFDARIVTGSAARVLVLREAGIDRAEMVIAVTDHDEVNLLVCQIAQVQSNARIKVLRLRTHEVQEWHDVLAKSGVHVDLITHPETELAESIMRVIRLPGVSDVHEFAGGAVQLIGMSLDAGNPVMTTELWDASAIEVKDAKTLILHLAEPQVAVASSGRRRTRSVLRLQSEARFRWRHRGS